MNVIKLFGGLGNQLFQYAFGRAMTGEGIDVYYDISWYKNAHLQKYPREFWLNKFVDLTTLTDSIKINQPIIKENNFDLSLLKKDGFNFEGYWQRFEYSSRVIHLLEKEITLKEEHIPEGKKYLLDFLKNEDVVSVHVRRTDYLEGFPIVPFSYYYEALQKTTGKIFIFSDDLKWCYDHFKEYYFDRQIIFVHNESFIDFELMKACRQNIIANSTFSWWAARLNTHPNKVVYAPEGWIGKCGDGLGDVHYPKDWIII
jgi:hypothetical protein